MQQPSDEIKQRLDIVDLIRDYIQLKPAGVNFRALCPFHREKTPSFIVSPEKQIWHCFGCGKGGDHFSFVMEMEGLSFVEALRLLAPKAGVALRRADPKLTSQRNRLLDIMEASAKYYYKNLLEKTQAEAIRNYLTKRGIDEKTIDDWQIGYAPDSWDDLINFLKAKKFNENEIFLAGMSIKKEGTGRFYNRFRDRIMFPIRNVNGQAVAFSARVNPDKEAEEKLGKYINSPQTMIYDKSRILYGLDKAKMAIKNEDLAIVVEGQMDVITAHQHGFKNVIAFSGTALSEEHIRLIKRYSNNIAFALDSDSAGDAAVSRGDDFIKSKKEEIEFGEDQQGKEMSYLGKGLSYDMNEEIIIIPKGKDPDEFIRENPEDWTKAVNNRKQLMKYNFENTFKDLDLDDIENRRFAAKQLLSKINKISNKIEQNFWLKRLSQKIDVPENILRETIESAPSRDYSAPEPDSPTKKTAAPKTREEILSESFLALLLKFPDLIEYAMDQVNIDQLPGLANEDIYKNLVIYYNSLIDSRTQRAEEGEGRPSIEYSGFKSWLEKNISPQKNISQPALNSSHNSFGLLDRLVLLGERDYYNLNNEQARSELIKIIAVLKKNYLRSRMREITKLISESEQAGDSQKAQELMAELKLLSDEEKAIG